MGINSPTIADVLQDELLERAYAWLCQQRKDHSAHNSVWHVRFHWASTKQEIKEQLLKGTYRLAPLKVYEINNERLSSWDAQDALVLKALSLTLSPLFTKDHYPECTHIKDAGGVHGALYQVSDAMSQYEHVLKSDIYSYYDSIDHSVVQNLLAPLIQCPIILDLISQYCERVEIKDGDYTTITRGIPKGSPLSPLIAALYLKPLDEALSQSGGFYTRFMDDWVVMVRTKNQLRTIVRLTHKVLKQLKLSMHPDKTFIGRIARGFDFLGLHFNRNKTTLSPTTIHRHQQQLAQRYAQGVEKNRIELYCNRWRTWALSALRATLKPLSFDSSNVLCLLHHFKQLKEIHHEVQNIRVLV